MRAPKETRRPAEIIREIVSVILQAPTVPDSELVAKGEAVPQTLSRISQDSISEDKFIDATIDERDAEPFAVLPKEIEELHIFINVRTAVKLFRELNREVPIGNGQRGSTSIWGVRTQNIEDFKNVKKQVERLSKTLDQISGTAFFHLFSDDPDVHLDQVPEAHVLRRARPRMEALRAILRDLHRRCDYLLKQEPGDHGHADHLGRWVTREAWRILRHAKRNPASGAYDSLFGTVARLLYEAVTGEADKDLQRACKAALTAAAEGELTVDDTSL